MKRSRTLAIILALSSLLGCTTLARDPLWRQVEEAIGKGLPQTAISVLEQIIPAALEAEAHADAIPETGKCAYARLWDGRCSEREPSVVRNWR